tara:strand:+ start:113 stop:391 length:279 start_codon:yes stop_codon:yes gene_type:complete
MLDIVFIVIVGFMIARVTPMKGLGDIVGCGMAGLILYGLVKVPFHLMVGGFTWPVSSDPTHHAVSGVIAMLIWVALLERTYRVKVLPNKELK